FNYLIVRRAKFGRASQPFSEIDSLRRFSIGRSGGAHVSVSIAGDLRQGGAHSARYGNWPPGLSVDEDVHEITSGARLALTQAEKPDLVEHGRRAQVGNLHPCLDALRISEGAMEPPARLDDDADRLAG